MLSKGIIMKKNILFNAIVLLSVLQTGRLFSMRRFGKIFFSTKNVVLFKTKQLPTSQQRKFSNQNNNIHVLQQILEEQKEANVHRRQQNKLYKKQVELQEKLVDLEGLKMLASCKEGLFISWFGICSRKAFNATSCDELDKIKNKVRKVIIDVIRDDKENNH